MAYLTVIIPHKNSFESLVKLLETIPNEVSAIVVDDKSDRTTQESLKELLQPNVRVIFNTDDVSNAGHARNLGIAALDETCEWVMFSDADDLMNKDSLIQLLADLKSEKSDVVLGGVDAIWDTGKPSERADYIKSLLAEYPNNKKNILFSWVGPIGKVIRKQLIVENGLKYESRLASNDVVFAAHLASLRPTLSVIERNLYTIIQSGSSLTASLTVEKAKARLEATWIRNQINAECKSGLKLHYGVTFYSHIVVHGKFSDALKYLPGELKNIMFCCYWNIKRLFVAR